MSPGSFEESFTMADWLAQELSTKLTSDILAKTKVGFFEIGAVSERRDITLESSWNIRQGVREISLKFPDL